MEKKRKGIALIEYFLLGATVTLASVALLNPYSDNIATKIRGETPNKASEVSYAAPPNPNIHPNIGGDGNDSGVVGSCDYLTLNWLRDTLNNQQYNYIASILTEDQLNATVNWVGPDGQTYTYPKYIVAQYATSNEEKADTSNYYLYGFSGNPGDIGYWPGESDKGYKDYYAVGVNYNSGDEFFGNIIDTPEGPKQVPSIDGPLKIGSSHPWLQTYQEGATNANDQYAAINQINFTTNHCPTFDYFATPLILDINGDGKVSAKAAIGVDINSDGRADGAAVKGDKMLAMSPIYGNKKFITGKEVFGDHTLDPFTGKPLKAANGFIALKLTAISAEKHTGVKCMEGSYANVKKLNAALRKAKKGKLGLISGHNITKLEPLGKVAKINTDYMQVASFSEDEIDVKHRQISNWLDIKNISHVIHDVWFAITNTVEKLMSNLAKAFTYQS